MRAEQPVVRQAEPRVRSSWSALDNRRQLEIGRRALVLFFIGWASAVSLLWWVAVVRTIDPLTITDVGLLPSVPVGAFFALGALIVCFAVALRMQPLPHVLLALQVGAAIFMLYGAPMLFEEMPRFVTAWLHVGFVDAIARTGELFPQRDARFDWPSFFVLFAFLQNVSGIDLLETLVWAPVVQMVLYCVPLSLIARSATGDGRLVWLTLWFFVLSNWVGQDYFSPQGMNLLLFLTLIAILLTWFRVPEKRGTWVARAVGWLPGVPSDQTVDPDGRAEGAPEARLDDRQQIGLVAVIALVFGMSVASHQLTPFAALGGVLLLTIAGRLRSRGLPILMLLVGITWLVFMATTFLDGRVSALLADVGRPDQFVEGNVAGRLQGSPGHVLAVQGRLVFSLGVWALALIGGLRRLRAGRFDLSLALLAAAPFGLVLVQGYGGEMVLRVFLFSLPFMAFFMASAVVPSARHQTTGTSIAIVGLSFAIALGFVFARYGNERADIVTPEDYRALEYLARVAEPGSVIATPNSRAAPEYIRFEQYRYPDLHEFVGADEFGEEEVEGLIRGLNQIADPGDAEYILVTRGIRAHAELVWGMSQEEWDDRMAVFDDRFEVVFRDGDAVVYRWIVPQPSS